ncbi:MAG TPA: 50S ribosomal protein L30 [Gammaproteobacteria bacterium]
MAERKNLKVTLLKSRHGRKPGHAECLAGLGLKHRHQSVVVADTPENRGMIDKVAYLVRVEEA